ncbi:hypothetical protein [uncultured Oscillibacter sp.]|uniref:hypothetical protein n=1 Tax=uncultured Oscillibacter sp. TaxID=876091 RepID=UPI0025DC3E0E|nr:hypothetical protein [uncultured Oscillibacter sp.]
MNERCAEPCADLVRLERQVEDLQRQNGEGHKELRDRLSRVETINAVQNTQYDAIMEKLDTLAHKVDALEAKPARRWDGLVERAVWAVCAAAVALLLAEAGL